MHILITGGAGFIGRSLQKRLAESNHHITLLDIKPPIPLANQVVRYVQADICDFAKMRTVFEKYDFDGVIHLAAVSRVVDAENNPQACVKTNVEGVNSLLQAIDASGQKPLLLFGSSREVYGESLLFPVAESAPKNAMNIYGESKIKGEKMFRAYSELRQLNCAVVRFSNVYGNRYDIFDRVIPRFIRAIVNGETVSIEGGKQLIDFTHIDDTVGGIERIINYLSVQRNFQDDYHLCPGVGWSLYQLIDYIEAATGVNAKVSVNSKRDYDVEKFVGDTQKIQNLLGLSGFIGLQQGIRLCLDEYCHDLEMAGEL